MRLAKTLAFALGGLAVLARPCVAQRSAPFQEQWFWGLKGGVTTFSTGDGGIANVPTWGADWLITRSHGGLYVSADQSLFGRTVTSTDGAAFGGTRQVEIKNLNRIGFAMVAFPARIGVFTPYGGVGAEISILGKATAQPDSLGGEPSTDFQDRVERSRSRASLLVLAGIQAQSSRVGFFVQETLLPAGADFLVKSPMSVFEIGIRRSFGSPTAGGQ